MEMSILVLGLVLGAGIILPLVIVALGCWLGAQLVRQNGRMLLRLDSLEQRLVEQTEQLNQRLGQMSGALEEQGGQLGNILTQRAVPDAAPQPAPDLPNGLPVGAIAPDFELPDLSGGRKSLSQFRGHRVLLVFFDPRCGFCTQMASDLAALPVDGSDGRPIPVVVTTGDAKTNRQMVKEYGIRCPVLLQERSEVTFLYQAAGTPTGYLIDEQGNIASDLAMGAPALLALAGTPPLDAPHNLAGGQNGLGAGNPNGHQGRKGNRSLAESHIARDGLTAGTPAPDFRLPRADGGEVSLQDYRGKPLLLVFSDPDCGPCNELAPQLEQLHQRRPDVEVVMVSRGQAEENLAKAAEYRLTFPIALQKKWEISKLYAMFGTPIGYLIDDKGIITKDVAVGAEPILNLLADNATATQSKRGVVPSQPM